MDGTPDRTRGEASRDGDARSTEPGPRGCSARIGSAPPRVLVVAADRAVLELLTEWLAACGCDVVEQSDSGTAASRRVDLLVVDVPFPRQGGLDLLRRLGRDHPRTPIVALSSNFFPGIESGGAVARMLGVARVLPMPVTGDALVAMVRQLLGDR